MPHRTASAGRVRLLFTRALPSGAASTKRGPSLCVTQVRASVSKTLRNFFGDRAPYGRLKSLQSQPQAGRSSN